MTIDHIKSLINSYKPKGILVDTNILLLWFIGSVNPQRLDRFNRTQDFKPEDYVLLLRLLNSFTKIVTTPNILTEVNSLASKIKEPERSQFFAVLAATLSTETLIKLEEHYIESVTATQVNGFNRFGLTDCGILELAHNRYLVLTDDYKLAGHLQGLDVDVINFKHLRNL